MAQIYFNRHEVVKSSGVLFDAPFLGPLSSDETLRTSAFLKADNDRNNMLETGEAAFKTAF